MTAASSQSHQLPGEADLGQRFTDAGYTNLSTGGENIFAFASSETQAHAAFMVDWGGPPPSGMQIRPGTATRS